MWKTVKRYNLIILIAILCIGLEWVLVDSFNFCVFSASRLTHMLRVPLIFEDSQLHYESDNDSVNIVPISLNEFDYFKKGSVSVYYVAFEFSNGSLSTENASSCIVPVLVYFGEEKAPWGMGHYSDIEDLYSARDKIKNEIAKYSGKWKLYLFGGREWERYLFGERDRILIQEDVHSFKSEVIKVFREIGCNDYEDYTSGAHPLVLGGIIADPVYRKIKYSYIMGFTLDKKTVLDIRQLNENI